MMNLSVIGTVFPVALVLGYLTGRWIGGWFEAVRMGGLIGALVGIAAGFYNMFKMVSRFAKPRDPNDSDPNDSDPDDTAR